MLQGEILEHGLMLVGRYVAKGHEDRVTGVIVALIKGFELGVAQVGNVPGVTAAVVVVGRSGEEVFAQGLPQNAGHRAARALHFVEYHALEYQLAVGVAGLGELHPVPFLGKVQRVQAGEKHRVQIHVQQVGKILAVLAGKGVGRPVTAGKGVHEGVEGTPQHHEKRVAHRIALAAAERSVLKNMGDAGGIRRDGAQGHQKYVLAAGGREVIVHGAGSEMFVLIHPHLQGFDVVAAQQAKCGMTDGCRSDLVHECPDCSQMRPLF
jgi:hypothetical protein